MAGTRKGTYKITNWRKYNESLVQRGSITFWFSEDVIEKWHHANAQPKVGHPFVYSDTAVECLLVLRELFQLPYRQTEGLGRSLVELMQIALDIPDYTSLAKRAAKLGVSLDVSETQRADRRGGRQHRPEGLRRRRVEDAQARQEQTSHLAEVALGGQSGHAGDRSGNPDGKQLRRRRPSGRPCWIK